MLKIILSLASYLLMVVGMLGLLATDSLFSPSPVVIVVQCAGVALMAWARVTFRGRSFHAAANPTPGGLVTQGPYQYIRHPIYTGACIFAWAGLIAHFSSVALLFGGLLLIGALSRMLIEEQLVAATYHEYRHYARRTKRMVPYVF